MHDDGGGGGGGGEVTTRTLLLALERVIIMPQEYFLERCFLIATNLATLGALLL